MELTGRAALITGGKRIGAAVALDFATRGADIALAYNRSADEAEAVAAKLRALGRVAAIIQADLSDPAQCRRLVDEAGRALGRLDVLVNMASVYRSVPLEDTDDAAWNAAIDVDLRASFLCAQAAIGHMRRAGGGRIINFTDWVAKCGVIGLTEALALELASDQILVNAIAPGPILAPEGTSADELRAVEAATPLGRWGGAAEIVKAVALLVESDFITGETIRVDGGRHVR
jgi:NAD(P)-dependent dehydrogenase (short-subunit alcohol dehydrogenase family)